MSKEEKARARQEESANKKRQREEKKLADKQQKLADKQLKLADKQQKLADKQAKDEQKAAIRNQQKQARGHFSAMEIACVMERRFFDDPRNADARRGAAEQPSDDKVKFMVAAGDCDATGAVWWTQRDHLKGGAAVSGLDVKTLDILVVVVPPATILSRLGSAGAGRGGGVAADGNVFPDLGRFVDGIRDAAPGFSRLVFVLEGVKAELDRQWAASVGSGNRSAGGCCCTRDEFEDAQCWLLVHKNVETRLTKNGKETGQYLWDLTRALSGIAYKDDVTELHCVSKSKTEARGSDRFSGEDKTLMDTWVRMLEQVQHISSTKAVELATHYPLPRDLVAALSDPAVPEAERATLLARKMGGSRTLTTDSRRIFELFTKEDGDFVIA